MADFEINDKAPLPSFIGANLLGQEGIVPGNLTGTIATDDMIDFLKNSTTFIVNSIADDLPAPVTGVITIDTAGTYIFDGVTFNGTERLTVAPGISVALIGTVGQTVFATTSGKSAFFVSGTAVETLYIEGMFFAAPGAVNVVDVKGDGATNVAFYRSGIVGSTGNAKFDGLDRLVGDRLLFAGGQGSTVIGDVMNVEVGSIDTVDGTGVGAGSVTFCPSDGFVYSSVLLPDHNAKLNTGQFFLDIQAHVVVENAIVTGALVDNVDGDVFLSGVTGSITSTLPLGGGIMRITTSAPHGVTGERGVAITGTVKYNGGFKANFDDGLSSFSITHTDDGNETSGSFDTSSLDENAPNWVFDSNSIDVPKSDAAQILELNNASTSLIIGGAVTINGGDNTKVDVAAGFVRIIDNTTDPLNPTGAKPVPFGPFTAATLNNLLTDRFTNLSIGSAGTLLQQSTVPSSVDLRSRAYIGQAQHPDMATVTNVISATVSPAINQGAALIELGLAIGRINIDGNVVGAGSQDLRLGITAGKVHFTGFNYQNDNTDPNFFDTIAHVDPTFIYTWRDGSGGFNTTTSDDILPDSYDDGTGGVGLPDGATPNNDISAHYVFLLPGDQVVVQFGQAVFANLDEALREIEGTPLITSDIIENAMLRAIILVREGETDWGDPTRFFFVPAGRFGDIGLGSLSASSVTLQQAYNNSTPSAEITTDVAGGPVDFQKGSGASSIIQQWKNDSGDVVSSMDDTGLLVGIGQTTVVTTSILSTTLNGSGTVAIKAGIAGQRFQIVGMHNTSQGSTSWGGGGDRDIKIQDTAGLALSLIDSGMILSVAGDALSRGRTSGSQDAAGNFWENTHDLAGTGEGFEAVYSGGTADYSAGTTIRLVLLLQRVA